MRLIILPFAILFASNLYATLAAFGFVAAVLVLGFEHGVPLLGALVAGIVPHFLAKRWLEWDRMQVTPYKPKRRTQTERRLKPVPVVRILIAPRAFGAGDTDSLVQALPPRLQALVASGGDRRSDNTGEAATPTPATSSVSSDP